MKQTFLTLLLAGCFFSAKAQYVFKSFDINPSGNSLASSFKIYDNSLFFIARGASSGLELHKTDGTTAGTLLVKDVRPGATSGTVMLNQVYGGKLYFTAQTDVNNYEPWISDGTETGTEVLLDINPATGSFPNAFFEFNGKLYFYADNGNGNHRWMTDGTSVGTVKTTTPVSGIDFTNFGQPVFYNSKYYFIATTPANGSELWMTDLTPTGTQLVKDINPGTDHGAYSIVGEVNGKLIFFAESADGLELWLTDGTSVGTQLLNDINPGPASAFAYGHTATLYNGKLIFAANDGVHGYENWVSDGTAAGTVMLKDIKTGISNSASGGFAIANGKAFFLALNDMSEYCVWVTDGTPAGTIMVKNLAPAAFPMGMAVYKNKVYFTCERVAADRQLYVTDGTATGTKVVAPPGAKSNALSYTPVDMIVYNDELYFMANYDGIGAELWSIKDTSSSTSVEQLDVNTSVQIFPNPTTGNIIVKGFKREKIEIYDLNGHLVYQYLPDDSNSNSNVTLPSHLPSGMYNVRLSNGEQVISKLINLLR